MYPLTLPPALLEEGVDEEVEGRDVGRGGVGMRMTALIRI